MRIHRSWEGLDAGARGASVALGNFDGIHLGHQAVIGEQLPGHGTVYLGQSLKFLAPVRPGDVVRAEVRVSAIDHARRRVTLETQCAVGDTVVLTGEALVLAPSRKFD